LSRLGKTKGRKSWLRPLW